jgi:hypothetical protein
MKYFTPVRSLLGCALALTACSAGTGAEGDAQLALVNAATATNGAELRIDAMTTALPTIGQSRSITIASGAHQLTLRSASGQLIASAAFSVPAGGRRTAVFAGSNSDSVAVSIVSDTMSTNSGGGYRSVVGSMLMVNAAAGVGPFNIVVHQVGSDSVYHFGGFGFGAGSLPPPAPYGFYIPFVPATYLIDITLPGSETPLAHTQLTLATDDRWIVMLGFSIEGELTLEAVKQP